MPLETDRRIVAAWRIPSDGWLLGGESDSDAVIFAANLAGYPSPLQPGDVLLAVEGVPLETLQDRAHAFYALRPPPWPDGAPMRYTVLRDGEQITVDVPLQRIAPWTYQLALFRTQGLVFALQLVSSLFFFGIGVAVFLLRPRERAAHALLILGTAFLFQGVPAITSITAAFFPFPPPSVGFDYWAAPARIAAGCGGSWRRWPATGPSRATARQPTTPASTGWWRPSAAAPSC
jgi:hypothetical protein